MLVAYLPLSDRIAVANSLQLPKDSLQRLTQLEQLAAEIAPKLLKSDRLKSSNQDYRPSTVYQLLRPYDDVSLILFAVRTAPEIRRLVWQYLTKLSQVKPFLNGNDLKKLGYQPGPIYKQIIEDLLVAVLDGQVGDRITAEAFVKRKYPSKYS